MNAVLKLLTQRNLYPFRYFKKKSHLKNILQMKKFLDEIFTPVARLCKNMNFHRTLIFKLLTSKLNPYFSSPFTSEKLLVKNFSAVEKKDSLTEYVEKSEAFSFESRICATEVTEEWQIAAEETIRSTKRQITYI